MSEQQNVEIPAGDSPVEGAPQPAYAPPTVTTYSSEEILERFGPAQACSPAPCGIF